MPPPQVRPAGARWVLVLACLLGLGMLPALIVGVAFFEASPNALYSTPVLAVIFAMCLHILVNGSCPRTFTESLTSAVREWPKRNR